MQTRAVLIGLAGIAILSATGGAEAPRLTGEQAARIAGEAYVFGLPLVLMDVTREVQTATPRADDRRAPVNQFLHSQKFPDHKFTRVVSPNADTLYSSAWLDLSQEPVVLSLPEMGQRYYLMQLLDAWTNVFACPGTRTTGNGKADFAVVGPGWKGNLPAGVKEIRSPTNMVWLIGRTQTNGKEDYDAVHAIQQRYRLAPLSAWRREHVPPDVAVKDGIDTKTPPAEQVAHMEPAAFFARLNALMRANPPANADSPALKRFAAIGVAPGKAFDLSALGPDVARGVEQGVRIARERLAAAMKAQQGRASNGWDVVRNLGRYGTNYPFRAAVSLFALGANLPEDALYPRTRKDADGHPLSGANRYVIQFPKGQLPPVNAFWSVTLYNPRQYFVENPIERYAIGDRDHLRYNDDGSLTIYIQHESPGPGRESNWLPAPEGEFNLFLRLYWPKKDALEGTWKPPAVQRIG